MIWIGTTQVAANTTPDSPGADVGNPTSNLHGWIQPATVANTDDATWIDSDMLQVKTRLPTDTPTTNTIEINGQQIHRQLPAGAQGGYQLLELDNSGASKWNQLYPITGNAGTDAATLNTLAYDINNATKNTTFLLQGFGNLPAIGSDTNLGNELQNIGGRADVVSRFNGKPDSTGGVYSLIAGPSPTAKNEWSNYAAEEASFERTGTTGTLSALLVRDATDNDYIPFTADSAAPDPLGTSRNGFLPTVYATPMDWTNWVRNDDGSLGTPTGRQTAAYSDLVSQVQSHHWVPKTQLCPAAPDAIRGYYCETDPDALGMLLNRISNQLKFNPTTAGSRYSESDWDSAQYTIEDELGDVSNIRSAIADYQGLFGTASIDGVVNAPAIGDAIKAAINKSTSTPTTADMNNVLSALTDMASVIPEIGPEMTFLSGAFSLKGNLEPDSTADDVLGPVQVTQDTAATTLVAAFQDASTRLSHYGDILVSDPTKLRRARPSSWTATPRPPTPTPPSSTLPNTPPSSGCGARNSPAPTACGSCRGSSATARSAPARTASASATPGTSCNPAARGSPESASAAGTTTGTGCSATTATPQTPATRPVSRSRTGMGSTTSACPARSRTRCSAGRSAARPSRA